MSYREISRIILITFLFWAIVNNLYDSRGLIFKETEWIWRFPFLSSEEKVRNRTSPRFYDFITFIRRKTPSGAVIMVPPQSNIWVFAGHIDYVQYFLYPRRLVKDDRERILKDKSITHIFINWGDAEIRDKRALGYPKYYVPVKRIFNIFEEKSSYPNRAPYLEKFGLIELERGTNEAESLAGIPANSVEYHFHRAEFLRAQNKFSEALAELYLAKKIKPNTPWVNYLLGDTYEKLGRLDLAVSYYNQSIMNSPETGWFYYALGRVYESLKKEDRAIEMYSKGLSVAPDSTWISFMLGRIYERKGELVNANLFYEKANYLNTGSNTFDSKMTVEALRRLRDGHPELAELVSKLKFSRELAANISTASWEKIDTMSISFDDRTTYRVYFSDKFPSREGTIEFYWQPPQKIEKLLPGGSIDLLHQLEYFLPHNGTLYLWVNPERLFFAMFDLGKRKWQILSSKIISWKSNKWYLISIKFGKNGMSLFVDKELHAKNDYINEIPSLPIFLGKGRIVSLLGFPKTAIIGYGNFDRFIFKGKEENLK